MRRSGLECVEWEWECEDAGNDGYAGYHAGNAGNHGGNAGNQGGNAANQGRNAGNEGRNAWNRGWKNQRFATKLLQKYWRSSKEIEF